MYFELGILGSSPNLTLGTRRLVVQTSLIHWVQLSSLERFNDS